MPPPTVAIVSAGMMGAAMGARLVTCGCKVFTNLDGRSEATKKRAKAAGMIEVPLTELANGRTVEWVLSVLPPSEAFNFAQKFIQASQGNLQSTVEHGSAKPRLTFADCNAVNPQTAKRIAQVFDGTGIKFIDAGIIGGPPSYGDKSYTPTIYASALPEDAEVLKSFASELNEYGLKVDTLPDASIGDASALKMSYAGITKGLTGIFSTMILAAHAASPATSTALLHELNESQPVLLKRIIGSVPGMLPKAYRWVGEMEEIAGFVGSGEGDVYKGIAELYRRIEKSVNEDADGEGAVGVLKKFVQDAKEVVGREKS